MATIKNMPEIKFNSKEMKKWGTVWLGTVGSIVKKTGVVSKKKANRFDKKQGMDFGKTAIDPIIAKALSTMLGGIKVVPPINNRSLLPPEADCIELGDTKVVGGVRSQNYDIAYRPDGIRIAYDSKTLNDKESVKKNWNNMINDLAAEATTLHTRFPYALALFFIIVPKPALAVNQATDLIRTLERMNERDSVLGENHKAESIAFVVWNPETGEIDPTIPDVSSSLRLEKFSARIQQRYLSRYKGLPPHAR